MLLLFIIVLSRFLVAKKHSESCKDIVTSGDAQGDGEYSIDPTASGNPFTVFCDMTTDGGKAISRKSIDVELPKLFTICLLVFKTE